MSAKVESLSTRRQPFVVTCVSKTVDEKLSILSGGVSTQLQTMVLCEAGMKVRN